MYGNHTQQRWQRLTVPIVMAVLFVAFSVTSSQYAQAATQQQQQQSVSITTPAHIAHQNQPAGTYDCAPNPIYCYGAVQWTNCGGLCNGVETTTNVKWVGCNPTYCTKSNYWHINQAEWLGEDDSWTAQNCTSTGGACWVAAGWIQGCVGIAGETEYCTSDLGTDVTQYYWEQARPGGCTGSVYQVAFFNPILPDYNASDTIEIQTTGNNGSHQCEDDQWALAISAPSGTYTADLHDNFMQANIWEIGLEVYGDQGQGASADDFTDNNFWPQGGSWQYTTYGPPPYSDSPAYGSWVTKPASGNHGGDFYDTCSCNYNG